MKEKYRTEQPLVFHTLRGERLASSLGCVAVEEENSAISAYELEVNVDYPTYQTIKHQGLFNLLVDQLLFDSDGSLEEQNVTINLRLKPNLQQELLQQASTPETISDYLTQLDANSEQGFFLSTESWLATEFTQVQSLPPELEGAGELKTGYQTLWAKPDYFKQQLASTAPMSMRGTILRYLEDNNIAYEQVNNGILRFQFRGENGEWTGLIKIDEANNQCAVYSAFPDLIPQEWRKACAVLLANANYDLDIGNFEIDLEDGDLRYRASLALGEDSLTPSLFEQLLVANLEVMDKYLPQIRRIIS